MFFFRYGFVFVRTDIGIVGGKRLRMRKQHRNGKCVVSQVSQEHRMFLEIAANFAHACALIMAFQWP